MPDDPASVATTYFDAWKANDFDSMRSLVADDVIFEGPLATLVGAEDYIKGIRGLSQIISEIVIRKVFVDGQDVLTWYEMRTTLAFPAAAPQSAPSRRDHRPGYGTCDRGGRNRPAR